MDVSLVRGKLGIVTHRALQEDHFYRAAWNADAVYRGYFCLSVRPSVKCVDCHSTYYNLQYTRP